MQARSAFGAKQLQIVKNCDIITVRRKSSNTIWKNRELQSVNWEMEVLR